MKVTVRNDVLLLRFENFENILTQIQKDIKTSQQANDDVKEFVPMLIDIKKERQDVKNKLLDYAGKGVFWIVATLLGINALK